MGLKIASLWHSGPLRNIERLCLASWIEAGAEVDLYTYGPVQGVPDGVRLCPGPAVLDDALLARLQPILRKDRQAWQPMMNFSDLFRVRLQALGAGLWLDGDVFLFRPFAHDPAKPYFAWEDHHRIGASVFYLPPDSPMVADYLRVLEDPDLWPHWLGFRRGVLKPAAWRLLGRPFSAPDLGITVYGNDAFSRLARKHGLLHHALGTRAFYAWNGKETLRFYDPEWPERLEDDPAVTGLHIHHKRHPIPYPPQGSLYDRMLRRLAHRLPAMDWLPDPAEPAVSAR
jgi:hypothetical protein